MHEFKNDLKCNNGKMFVLERHESTTMQYYLKKKNKKKQKVPALKNVSVVPRGKSLAEAILPFRE